MTPNFEELEKIAKLKEQWILSQEEFEIEKKKILSWEDNNKNNSWYWNMNYKSLPTYIDNSNHDFFQKFFSHKWRMNRGEYLIYLSISFLPTLLIVGFLGFFRESKELIPIVWTGFIIYTFIWIYAIYILTIKKLHDIDTSWWLSIIVNIFAPISTFILLFIPWTKWDNKYGPYKWKDKVWQSLLIIFWGIILFTILLWLIFNINEKIQKNDSQIETPIWTWNNEETIDLDAILNDKSKSCGKNSAPGEDGKCHCLSWYKWENYEDANNFDCIKK